MAEEKKERTLQELFGELDVLIRDMEEGELSLEKSFSLYHQGMETLKQCNEKIDRIEKKMMVLDEEGGEHEFE